MGFSPDDTNTATPREPVGAEDGELPDVPGIDVIYGELLPRRRA